ncbi:Alkyl sulfatase BDS1, metallo-beta-lactamase superfamily [Desulfocicer vacuolatum DSM 3385]|uniref:Alkyl sulfatase BDS1, metallo-beta-lactamase superfamily n=1 Tax=Desulfocicer vacuolatum DSM 3385 TaxID=1121400 RepID=A0A1W2D5A5_9BACT|nr:alkyl sulfatase dimerization domain-containing protein [Desulfocicer vacuolatum]SMC92653.1 Alkyl sulfatase BDS1, metallo-beta-lactamase superfamily [Desulfocicer vacuolatum DSM 3385]
MIGKKRMYKLFAAMVLALCCISTPYSFASQKSDGLKHRFNDPALNNAMGADVTLGEASNGALVNQTAIDNAKAVKYQTTEIFELYDGVYIMPDQVVNSAFIIAPEGVIVWETGENLGDGKHYREEIRKITDKPIKAVIYSHSHYTQGTSALIQGESDVMIIGHPNLNENMKTSGLGSYFPELEPLQLARAMQQVNMFLPKEGPDAKYGLYLELNERGFVPVNTPVKNGQILNVAGIDLQFFTEGGSDTDDCTTVWIPSKKLVLNNLVWPFMPNIATPRGSKFRDPRIWVKGLSVMRDLEPEFLVNQHAVALKGKEKIRQLVTDYMDFLNLILDQTLRGILKGLGPEELRDFVVVPPHLQVHPWLFESYGIQSWISPYIMNYALGWWDGDAATLFKLPPKNIAERLVPALGGRDKVVRLAKDAQQKKEYAWSLELLNYLLRISADDADALALKANIMSTMAYSSTSSIARSYLLTQARSIRKEGPAPVIIPPTKEQIASSPDKFVDYYRVRLDPIKAQNTDKVLAFDFTENNEKVFALHIRKGVCEYIPDVNEYYRPADITLSLGRQSWAKLYLNEMKLQELVAENEIKIKGGISEATTLLNLFDLF